MRYTSLIVALVAMLTSAARAQTDATPPRNGAGDLHWAQRMSQRVRQVNRAFPVIDRVVLVPDDATYLDELRKWSPEGRWPVLYEDDRLAPMFIRRFEPAQVIRRESVGKLPDAPQARQQQIESAVVCGWGGDPDTMSVTEAFEQHGFTPLGVVVTSASDGAWPAAVALAAGRGQPIIWLDGRYGRPNQAVDRRVSDQFRHDLVAKIAELGYPFDALGDAIDTITICRRIAGKVKSPAADGKTDHLAITDVIGRQVGSRRFAFVGWIFGNEARSAYAAMCSLFLERSRFMLVNTYPEDGQWGVYGTSQAVDELNGRGYVASGLGGNFVSQANWLRMLAGGVSSDVLIMNTKGNADFFDLASGRASPDDVPILNEPLALHFLHSWSLRSPVDEGTVGGQWLAHGAYAYVGSVQEPFLAAFVPPTEIGRRLAAGVPFLVASRWWPGQGQVPRPWKVNTLGDPQMLCLPAELDERRRVERGAEYGIDLQDVVRELMEKTKTDETGEVYGEAIRTLVLLGRDDIAVQLWTLAVQNDRAVFAAQPALGPLFRARDLDGFMSAWDDLAARDHFAVDMLWHLVTPRLRSMDELVLIQLQSAIREPHRSIDVERLAPHLKRVRGPQAARSLVQNELNRATRKNAIDRLQKLLDSL